MALEHTKERNKPKVKDMKEAVRSKIEDRTLTLLEENKKMASDNKAFKAQVRPPAYRCNRLAALLPLHILLLSPQRLIS